MVKAPGRFRLKLAAGAIGVDEAGRGPLAGPVVVAAVILPARFPLQGLTDSKLLTPDQRERHAARIKAKALWSVSVIDHLQIDRLNILWASMLGMEQAVEDLRLQLGETDAEVLIDGDRVPTGLLGKATAVVKGDSKYGCIAAASILAKTHRDALMREMSALYPQYGFDSHFGYSTPEHFEALRTHGPCPIHRRSFAPVREAEQPCLIFGP